LEQKESNGVFGIAIFASYDPAANSLAPCRIISVLVLVAHRVLKKSEKRRLLGTELLPLPHHHFLMVFLVKYAM
jgi:hypothetical protein